MYQYKKNDNKGRTMIEMLAILCIIAVLTYLGLRGFDKMLDRSKARAIEKAIRALVYERQASPNAPLSERQTIKGPYGNLYLDKGTGNKEQYFYIETDEITSGLCEQLLGSYVIQPDALSVNGTDDGSCDEERENVIRFYFSHNVGSKATWTDERGMVHNCDRGATSCDKTGTTTSCKAGLYLSGTNCLHCPSPMTMCSDANTATGCENGYYLSENSCVSCGEGVATCDAQGQATSCGDGYYLDEGTCIACPTRMAKCTGPDEATECVSGYYLNNGKCQSCVVGQFKASDGKCYTCSLSSYKTATADECHACDNRFMYNTQCRSCSDTQGLGSSVSEWHRCSNRFGLYTGDTTSWDCAGTVRADSSGKRHCDIDCTTGSTFGGTGQCLSCTGAAQSVALHVVTAEEAYNYCSSCPNRTFMWSGNNNLNIDHYCAKNCTGSGQFLDAYGNCYTCESSGRFFLGWTAGRNEQYSPFNTLLAHCLACPNRFYQDKANAVFCYHCNQAGSVEYTSDAQCARCKGYRYTSATNTCTKCPTDLSTLTTDTAKSQCCPIQGTAQWASLTEANRAICCANFHATNCDAEGNFTCTAGYDLYNGKCVPNTCSVDADCYLACATCVNGRCSNECDLGQCDTNDPCIEYDSENQTCNYVCTKVKYLQSSGGGTQRIDTKVDGNTNNLEIEIKFNLLGYNSYAGLFGNYKDENTNVWRIIQQNSNNTNMLVYPNVKANASAKTITVTKNAVHTIRYNRSSITVDGTNYTFGTLTNGNANTDSTKRYIQLFRGGYASTSSNLRIYYCKIWSGGILVRDFIPVLDKDNKPAMLDKVHNVLYYTPSGTFGYEEI